MFKEEHNSYSLVATPVTLTTQLYSGLHLVLAGIDGIPPHIALLYNGKYFSVSTRKVDVGIPAENFIKAIKRHNTPVAFVQIKFPFQDIFTGEQDPMFLLLSKTFGKYPVLGSGQHSCLWPICDFFANVFSPEFSKCSLVFEILALAQQQNLLAECKIMFTNNTLLEGDGRVRSETAITLPKYTHDQIRQKIDSLLKVNG